MPRRAKGQSPICVRCYQRPPHPTHNSYCAECLSEYMRERQQGKSGNKRHLELLRATGRRYG